MPRTRSPSGSPRRSRSPRSDRESSDEERPTEYRVHIADLPPGTQDQELRKVFQRFGTIIDLWLANASCFAFVVYKYKEDAQKAIDQMDGRSFGNARVKVTWARPRARNRSHRHDPNMRCYKCGQRGHFSRECDGQNTRRRVDDGFGRYPPIAPPAPPVSSSGSYGRSRSPYSSAGLPPPSIFRHGLPMYPPSISRRYDPYMDAFYLPVDRPNPYEGRHRDRDRDRDRERERDRERDRGTRLTPPSTSGGRYSRR